MSNLAQHVTLKSMRDKVTPAEWQARVDLAACYRLVAHYEMSDMMANHISAAVPGEDNAFLINAYGMLYEKSPPPASSRSTSTATSSQSPISARSTTASTGRAT